MLFNPPPVSGVERTQELQSYTVPRIRVPGCSAACNCSTVPWRFLEVPGYKIQGAGWTELAELVCQSVPSRPGVESGHICPGAESEQGGVPKRAGKTRFWERGSTVCINKRTLTIVEGIS